MAPKVPLDNVEGPLDTYYETLFCSHKVLPSPGGIEDSDSTLRRAMPSWARVFDLTPIDCCEDHCCWKQLILPAGDNMVVEDYSISQMTYE